MGAKVGFTPEMRDLAQNLFQAASHFMRYFQPNKDWIW
jgi:hypothetical protein